MQTKPQGSHPHFNPFFENNTLLIQFIIEEFLHSHQLIAQMSAMLDETASKGRSWNPSTSFIPLLEELAGSSHPQERQFLSRWAPGTLTKLKDHCEQFVRNSADHNKRYLNLHMSAHQAWLAALYTLELLSSLYSTPFTQSNIQKFSILPVKRSFQTLMKRFVQFTRTLRRVVNDFVENENVVYYILRHRTRLDEIYGYDFIGKHVGRSRRKSDFMLWLIERYQVRGFDALLPKIRHLIEKSLER